MRRYWAIIGVNFVSRDIVSDSLREIISTSNAKKFAKYFQQTMNYSIDSLKDPVTNA